MFRYYCRAVLIPAIPVMLMLCCIIFSLIYPFKELTEEDGYGLEVFLICVHALYFCLASLPILLNRYKVVRTNKWLSILSWVLLPSGLICLLISECFVDDARIGYLFFAGCDLIYMIGLLLAYNRFRWEQANQTNTAAIAVA